VVRHIGYDERVRRSERLALAGRVALLVVVVALLAGPVGAAAPIAHREILPNGIVLLVAERPGFPSSPCAPTRAPALFSTGPIAPGSRASPARC
jgi:hypothetical protein